jgi:hypothetical protein
MEVNVNVHGNISSDGDCLFDSLAKMIIAETHRKDITPQILRKLVADSVLSLNNATINNAIEIQRELCHQIIESKNRNEPQSDLSVLSHLKHIISANERFDNVPDNKATEKMYRQLLCNAMMDRKLYWGDEYALNILENILDIKIVVLKVAEPFKKDRIFYVPKTHVSDPSWKNSDLILFIELHNSHYSPVGIIDPENKIERFVWYFEELPNHLKNILYKQ